MLQEALVKSTKYDSNSRRKINLDNTLLHMIATNLQPSSIVEDEGLKRFVNLSDSRYQLPNRRNLICKLPLKYEEVKTRVKDQLTGVGHVSLTTDIWTSRPMQSYITVTCHLIHHGNCSLLFWKLSIFV